MKRITRKYKTKSPSIAAIAVALCSLLLSCGNGKETPGNDLEKAIVTNGYEEGENFPENLLPGELKSWINYYQALDTSVKPSNFKASGVALHFGPLEEATSGDFSLSKDFYPLMAFSPDSSRVIDWISYNHIIETMPDGTRKLIGGEADQEVALRFPGKSITRQLMFNGPQSAVEAGSWLTNEAFVLGMIQVDEMQKTFTPEIMLFNLEDSSFTNFRLNRSISIERQAMQKGTFTETWLKEKKFQP